MGLKRSGFLKRTRLKSRGHRSTLWDAFAEQERRRARDTDGLIACEDWKVGLPRCYRRVTSPDLHHTEGRDGELLLDRSKMVWLVRTPCHDYAHNPAHIPDVETQDDSTGSLDQQRERNWAPSGNSILPMARRSPRFGEGPTRREIRRNISSTDAAFLERTAKGTI